MQDITIALYIIILPKLFLHAYPKWQRNSLWVVGGKQ